jgi:hypothetical protein
MNNNCDYLPTDIPGVSAVIEDGRPRGLVTDLEALLHHLKFNPGPVTVRILKPKPEPVSTLLYGLEEVAAYAGVSVRTVRNWARERGLTFSRPRNNLIALQEGIDAFIESHGQQSGHPGQPGQNPPTKE